MSGGHDHGSHGGDHGKGGLYAKLEERFDFGKNPLYKKVHSSHSRSHNDAVKALGLGDTTGFDENKIIEHMAKYMVEFDQRNGKAPKELDEVRKKEYAGKAHEFLEEVAKGRKVDMQTLMTQLYKEGIDSVLEAYRDNEREDTTSRLHRAHLREVTSSLDYDMRLGLTRDLQDRIPELKDQKAEELVPALDQILYGHFTRYHERSVQKAKKAAKKGASAHATPAAAAH